PTDHPPTAVERAVLERIIQGVTSFPADFHLHPKLSGSIQKRREALEANHIDWALAETLAFGSLVLEGTPVRLSGQDSGRGTFSQRHAEFHDAESDRVNVPLQHLAPGQARFEVFNSPLSEYSVMGFEFGYSVADPLTLVLWEAQFGDFANGAQIMIDQFIAAAETKWSQPSGLVLLLPHGYEGQGPEHSSARIERYLQLCAEDNMQVCNLTTAANYFHALRRQIRRKFRKPLVVVTPKSLLRAKEVASPLAAMGPGTMFHRIIEETDTIAPDERVRRVVLCSGKIYFDLLKARAESGDDTVALVRVEQLYPFPFTSLGKVLRRYRNAEIVWCQEEPQNMGAWNFVDR